MHVFLVRHGEAKSKREDPERSLSEKGLADIKKEAAFIAENFNIAVKKIYHSRKTRARQTAEVLGEYLKPPEGIHEADGLEPMADIYPWVDRTYAMKENTMIVGHLPFLEKLASYLLCQDENKQTVIFETCGIVSLGRTGESKWYVRWMISPGIVS